MKTTNEYRIKIVVRNNLLLSNIEAHGYTSIPKFARDHGISYVDLNLLISLKRAPIGADGRFSKTAQQLMEVFGAAPLDLWSEEQLTMSLRKNYSEREVGRKEFDAIAAASVTGRIEHPSPEDALYKTEVSKVISDALNTITPRERKVLTLRYGVSGMGGSNLTLDEIGDCFDVSKERIRQIEVKAFRKIKELQAIADIAEKPTTDNKK